MLGFLIVLTGCMAVRESYNEGSISMPTNISEPTTKPKVKVFCSNDAYKEIENNWIQYVNEEKKADYILVVTGARSTSSYRSSFYYSTNIGEFLHMLNGIFTIFTAGIIPLNESNYYPLTIEIARNNPQEKDSYVQSDEPGNELRMGFTYKRSYWIGWIANLIPNKEIFKDDVPKMVYAEIQELQRNRKAYLAEQDERRKQQEKDEEIYHSNVLKRIKSRMNSK